MQRFPLVAAVAILLLGGCASQTTNSGKGHTLASDQTTTPDAVRPQPQPAKISPDDTIATVKGRAITRAELERPVFEAFGLRFLLCMAQEKLACEKAREKGIIVSEAELAHERDQILEAMFGKFFPADKLSGTDAQKAEFRKIEFEKVLVQYLDQRHVTVQEFNLGTRIHAYVRKIAEAEIAGQITEPYLRAAFDIEYGEKVKVRHIQVANDMAAAEVLRRLNAHEKFEDLARELSQDRDSAQVGGEIRPISRQEKGAFPDIFIDAAFALDKPGDVSDAVKAGNAVHIIKLVERIPPTEAKFEEHRDEVYKKFYDQLLLLYVNNLNSQYGAEVAREIRIEDPVLRKQFVHQLDLASGDTHDTPEHARMMLQAQQNAATRPAITPPPPTTQPGRGEFARPPATMPGR